MIFGIIDYIKYLKQFGRYSVESMDKIDAKLATNDIQVTDESFIGATVLLHTRISFVSWMVMYFGNSIWSHTSIICENGMLLDFTTSGLIKHSFNNYLDNKSYLMIYKLNLPLKDRLRAIEKVTGKSIGLKYNWLHTIKMLFQVIFASVNQYRIRITLDFLILILCFALLFKINIIFMSSLIAPYLLIVLINLIRNKIVPSF